MCLSESGFIRVREMSGKFKFFQGQGIVREFYAVSVKNEVLLKCQGNVREFYKLHFVSNDEKKKNGLGSFPNILGALVKLLKTNILNASKFLLAWKDAFEAKYSLLSKHDLFMFFIYIVVDIRFKVYSCGLRLKVLVFFISVCS